jgi:hypothetical protein
MWAQTHILTIVLGEGEVSSLWWMVGVIIQYYTKINLKGCQAIKFVLYPHISG